jgi:hypothetical protein
MAHKANAISEDAYVAPAKMAEIRIRGIGNEQS